MIEKMGPLFEMQQSAKNKRVCADQCRKEAANQIQRAENHEAEAAEYERAAKLLESL